MSKFIDAVKNMWTNEKVALPVPVDMQALSAKKEVLVNFDNYEAITVEYTVNWLRRHTLKKGVDDRAIQARETLLLNELKEAIYGDLRGLIIQLCIAVQAHDKEKMDEIIILIREEIY